MKDHLIGANSNSDLTHHAFIARFYDKETSSSLRSCSLKSLLDDEPNQNDVVSTWVNQFPAGFSSIHTRSCHGLILMSISTYGRTACFYGTLPLENSRVSLHLHLLALIISCLSHTRSDMMIRPATTSLSVLHTV